MYRIVTKTALKPTVILYEIEAPMVAKKAQPGQFIILRVDENGERIPITIHDYDREKGTVTITCRPWALPRKSSATRSRVIACTISSVLWVSPLRLRARKRSA